MAEDPARPPATPHRVAFRVATRSLRTFLQLPPRPPDGRAQLVDFGLSPLSGMPSSPRLGGRQVSELSQDGHVVPGDRELCELSVADGEDAAEVDERPST